MAYGERRINLTPAVAVSLLLHVGVAAAILWQWQTSVRSMPGSAVAVTIVSEMPTAPTPAPTPQLEEAAPPAPEPPTPAPVTPPAAAARPTPAPAKPTKSPTAAKDSPSVSSLEALMSSIQNSKTQPASHSGPRKVAGAPHAGPVAAPNPSRLGGFVDKVGGLWNIDCDVADTRQAKVKVSLTISTEGRVTAGPTVINPSQNAVFAGAEAAAVRAIRAGQPYSLVEVPSEFRNKGFIVNFYGEDVCKGR